MAKSFLTKREVRQIIKSAWGLGKPAEWKFEYMGKDSVYLSYVHSQVDCLLMVSPAKTPGIVYYQLLRVQDGVLNRYCDHLGREKFVVFYYDGSCYAYAGVAYGSLFGSQAYQDALERVKVAA